MGLARGNVVMTVGHRRRCPGFGGAAAPGAPVSSLASPGLLTLVGLVSRRASLELDLSLRRASQSSILVYDRGSTQMNHRGQTQPSILASPLHWVPRSRVCPAMVPARFARQAL